MTLLGLISMASPQGDQSVNPMIQMAPIFIVFFVFYFVLIRPQAKKQKDVEKMLQELKKGDRVVTNGGLHGRIAGVKEDIVVLEVATNVKVEVSKSAVTRVIQE